MKMKWLWGAAFVAVAGLAGAGEIPLDQVPETVRRAFQQQHPGARKVEVEYEADEYGEPLYEFEFRQDGDKVRVFYHTDGSLFGYERKLPPRMLPEAVRRNLASLFPGERIDIEEAEVVVDTDDRPLAYEVELETAAGREWKVYLNADGSVIEKRPD